MSGSADGGECQSLSVLSVCNHGEHSDGGAVSPEEAPGR